jgi:hypothetical protein
MYVVSSLFFSISSLAFVPDEGEALAWALAQGMDDPPHALLKHTCPCRLDATGAFRILSADSKTEAP